jgi:hypothetical protein
MNINDAQQQLFQLIKARVPSEASVADEVAKLLNLKSFIYCVTITGSRQTS